jgi:hypothetical protein
VQAKLAHRLPKLAREGVVAVDARGQGADLVAGKAARRLADGFDGFAEIEVENGSLPWFVLLLGCGYFAEAALP